MRRANLGSWAGMWLDGRGARILKRPFATKQKMKTKG